MPVAIAASVAVAVAAGIPAAADAQTTSRTSSALAGYELKASPTSATLVATIVVPHATCTQTSELMSIGVFFLKANIVGGGAFVQVDCSSGSVSYNGQCVHNGGDEWPVNAGDTVQVSFARSNGECALHDTTNGQGGSLELGPAGAAPTALVGVVPGTSGGVPSPVPTFKSIAFSSVSIDGTTVAASGAVRYNLTGGGLVEIATSALNSTGDGFREIFKAN